MTDNEIIKDWGKILATGDAPIGEHWSVGGIVTTKLAKETFDMLNRQKAEIERLYEEGLRINEAFMGFVHKRKFEAIKEFAEKLKKVFPSIAGAIDYIADDVMGRTRRE